MIGEDLRRRGFEIARWLTKNRRIWRPRSSRPTSMTRSRPRDTSTSDYWRRTTGGWTPAGADRRQDDPEGHRYPLSDRMRAGGQRARFVDGEPPAQGDWHWGAAGSPRDRPRHEGRPSR